MAHFCLPPSLFVDGYDLFLSSVHRQLLFDNRMSVFIEYIAFFRPLFRTTKLNINFYSINLINT